MWPHTRTMRATTCPTTSPEVQMTRTAIIFENCGELAPQSLINGSTTTQRVEEGLLKNRKGERKGVENCGTGIILLTRDRNHFFFQSSTLQE